MSFTAAILNFEWTMVIPKIEIAAVNNIKWAGIGFRDFQKR